VRPGRLRRVGARQERLRRSSDEGTRGLTPSNQASLDAPPARGQAAGARDRTIARPLFHFAAIALMLASVASLARAPASSDREIYQAIGRHGVVLDCHDVHCFRILVAVVLEHLPGPSVFKWKAYAVLSNAAAALAVGRLCLALGLAGHLATLATWLAATGFGPLQSVFDPFTSDPLMYWLGPVMAANLLQERRIGAAVIGAVGVLAKEFAAVPLWMFTVIAAVERRWDAALRNLAAATTVTLVWFALQTTLLTLYNYSYGNNPSVNLTGGGYFTVWANAVGWPRAIGYLFTSFGPLYFLMAVGLLRAGRTGRLLAASSLPAVIAFMYVQQPDRSLCNFQFVVVPLAVSTLDVLPVRLRVLFVIAFGVANLRLGAGQPVFVTGLRMLMLALSIAIALYACVATSNASRRGSAPAALP
jgi:hypothetical protein